MIEGVEAGTVGGAFELPGLGEAGSDVRVYVVGGAEHPFPPESVRDLLMRNGSARFEFGRLPHVAG